MADTLTLAQGAQPPGGGPSRLGHARWLPWGVLVLGLLVTALLCVWSRQVQRAEAHALLERHVDNFGQALSAQVQSYIDTLPGLRVFGILKASPSDAEFLQYVEAISLQRRFPGLALTFVAELVPLGQRPAYAAAVRNDRSMRPEGHPGFEIKPTGARPLSMVLRHSYPFDTETFGYDIYDPQQNYRAAAEAAIASGGYVATGPILLARDRFKQDAQALTSVVIRAAIYDGGLIPPTEAARHAAARGLVGISFSMVGIVKSVLPKELGTDTTLRITDPLAQAAGANALLFDSRWLAPAGTPAAAGADGEPIHFRTKVANRVWDIAVTQQAPLQAVDGVTALIGMVGGVLSLALAAMTQALVNAYRHAEQRVLDGLAALQTKSDTLARSEARYRLLFANSLDAVMRTRPGGSILAANAAACRLFGRSEAELLVSARESLVDVSDPRLALLLAQRQHTGRGQGLCRMRRADGSTFEAEVSSATYTDDEGLEAASLVVRDVTERQMLAAHRQRLTAILDATPDFVGSTDPQGRNIFLNLAARRMLGRGALDDVSGLTIADCHPPWAARLVVDQGLPAAIRDGAWTGRTAILAAGGHEIPVSQVILCHRASEGDITHFSTIARDLSELEQAQAERQGLERRMLETQKMESIGTLAGGVAHDFNNVLAAILGNALLARQRLPADAEAHTNLQLIQQAARRARTLVQQILTFSRRAPQERTVVPLRDAVDEALALLRTTLPASAQLAVTWPAEPLSVVANVAQVQQVVLNLCTNAWQAFGDGGGHIVVSVGAVDLAAGDVRPEGLAPGRYARLSVADDGAGMDAATRSRIFEPFFTTKPAGQGTGLGLSVVHGIVSAGGGAITVDSQPGQGTRFDVYLPRVDAAAVETPPPAPPDAPPTGAWHVLYVDDDPVVTLTVEALLQRAGHRVTTMAEPALAIEAVRAGAAQFDLVLTDHNMPGMSGLMLAEALRKIAPGLPVVVTSGYVTDDLHAQARRVGARAVISKEFSVERLNTVLADHLDGLAVAGRPEPG